MKVTRLGRTRPLVSLAGILSGGDSGPGGQVPTSVGSNGAIAWGSNVGTITVNGTTLVSGPYINIANGSNTTVTVDQVGSVASNTIRIHATASGASPLTTKGDLYTRTSSADARLAVGSNGAGIIADDSQTVGIRWTTAALHGELLMQDGVSGPPVPLESDPGQNDWLYGDL